jgi:hypothetical protein
VNVSVANEQASAAATSAAFADAAAFARELEFGQLPSDVVEQADAASSI